MGKNDENPIAVNCSAYLRTFAVVRAVRGVSGADCVLCRNRVKVELVCEPYSIWRASARPGRPAESSVIVKGQA
jgi:hypothetical protein